MPNASGPSPAPTTFFLPAGRAVPERLVAMERLLQAVPLLTSFLETIPEVACVLNEHRQIVAANRRLLDAVGAPSFDQVRGLRLGEALECVRARAGPDGCGTGPACVTCGAAQAMQVARASGTCATRECRITVERGSRRSLDFSASASPVDYQGESFLVCILRDIAAEKRRAVLERVFFHDVLNTAGGLRGLAELAADPTMAPSLPEAPVMVARLSAQVVDEIEAQRALVAAERDEYQAESVPVDVLVLLHQVADAYRGHDVGAGRQVAVLAPAGLSLATDASLLRRVLGNLVKNALEATPLGATVHLTATADSDDVVFAVWNPGAMPPAVQAQVFQRSFTTKRGLGRGIGTYSVQLFAEHVLGGRVDFASTVAEGTWFRVRLRRSPPVDAS